MSDQLNGGNALPFGAAGILQHEQPKDFASITNLQHFQEMFPDPQDYCIGVLMPVDTSHGANLNSTRNSNPPLMASLDERIE